MSRPHELALPPLSLGDWRATRDRLHRWARYAGAVRRQLLPPRRRWAHASLLVSARGLSTGPFPVPGGAGEIVLDLVAGNLLVFASDGWELHLPLAADPGSPLRERLAGALAELEVDVELPRFDGGSPGPYEPAAAARWLRVVTSLDGVLRALRSEGEMGLAGPTPPGSWSEVQLWPQHSALFWHDCPSRRQEYPPDPARPAAPAAPPAFGAPPALGAPPAPGVPGGLHATMTSRRARGSELMFAQTPGQM